MVEAASPFSMPGDSFRFQLWDASAVHIGSRFPAAQHDRRPDKSRRSAMFVGILLQKITSTSLNRDRTRFPFDCAGRHAVT